MLVGQAGGPDGGVTAWPKIAGTLPLTHKGVKEKFTQARDSARQHVLSRARRRPPLPRRGCQGHRESVLSTDGVCDHRAGQVNHFRAATAWGIWKVGD